MRKGILMAVLCFFIISLFMPAASFAATVGNPSTTDIPEGVGVFSMKRDSQTTIKISEDIEHIFDRDLVAGPSLTSSIQIDQAQWYMTKIYYGILNDRVQPYLQLGAAHMEVSWNENGVPVEFESDTAFAWGLGVKALVWEIRDPKIKIVADGVYRMADLNAEDANINGSTTVLDTSRSRFFLREWQLSVLAAGELDVTGGMREEVLGISKLVPYVGVKYSDVSGRFRATTPNGTYYNPGEFESDENIGFFVGCDILGTDSVLLNVEGRFVDENALTGGIAILF
ncbi:MAG: hypothetical protein HQ547_07125 [Candidatus Omnitrophica bacterium]|nr:hypothetical protein [Candidatus Omnitrophota bacterium]